MAMTVKRSQDTKYRTAFMSGNGKVTDIPQGTGIKVSELINSSVLLDGYPVARAVDGLTSIVKTAKCLTGTTSTSIIVDTDGNQFKVGDKVFALLNGKHYAITTVTNNGDGTTTLTVGTAIDAPLTNGGFIYQNADAADGATGAALIANPVGVTGTSKSVDTSTNMDMDVWVQGAVKYGLIGPVILDAIKASYSLISEV